MPETEYTTIRVSKEAWAEAKEKKGEGQTWNEYITDENRGRVDPDELAELVAEKTAGKLGKVR